MHHIPPRQAAGRESYLRFAQSMLSGQDSPQTAFAIVNGTGLDRATYPGIW
jgi:hypothetical protein